MNNSVRAKIKSLVLKNLSITEEGMTQNVV